MRFIQSDASPVCWQIAHRSPLTVVTPLGSGESKHDLIDLHYVCSGKAKLSIYT